MSGPRSLFLSPDHLCVVVLAISLNVAACSAARRAPRVRWVAWFRVALAAALVTNAVWMLSTLIGEGRWSADIGLPLQLCDAATAVSVLALLRPSPLAFELTYFWGLGAALQGLITPAITHRCPDPVFFQFFVLHVGLVTAASFLAFGLGMSPRPGVVVRMMVWTNGFAAAAGIVNWATGGNYMFLREPPPTGSLLDALGRWPWYLFWCEGVAIAVFWLLRFPFLVRDRGIQARE